VHPLSRDGGWSNDLVPEEGFLPRSCRWTGPIRVSMQALPFVLLKQGCSVSLETQTSIWSIKCSSLLLQSQNEALKKSRITTSVTYGNMEDVKARHNTTSWQCRVESLCSKHLDPFGQSPFRATCLCLSKHQTIRELCTGGGESAR
jgi:hypothetical protein